MDVQALRAETPGCARVAHLNNAGAALPPAPVLDAVRAHLELEATIGGYEAQEAAAAEIARFYDAAAALVGASPAEIAYVENATRAWDMAFYSIPFAPGDRILTTASEYSSNAIAYQQVARARGAVVEALPDDAHGQVCLEALEKALRAGGVRLVSLNHVPSQNGLVNPVAEVGRLCRAAGVPFLLDACQSLGQLPVDVDEIGCDMLSATGRKFLRGPRGTGFLYVRKSVLESLEPPFLDLQAAEWHPSGDVEIVPDARRFETWERFMAGQIGLGVAIDYALSLGLEEIRARVDPLAGRLRDSLAGHKGVTVLDRGIERSGIVTFTVEGREPDEIKHALRERGVNVNVTHPSGHGYDPNLAPEAVRASVHYYNTEDELERVLEVL
ncbi:aminotransferase class V-fold PLP-dependent enzyme [Actinomadura parmotrematis]|uniref:Aminotransferase class V-fold PLP-dependent enzyme n=1 Tax=Actinomadura parmotrematis TaxID=2864039 RepID=A0ABS7FU92_9ACTN|nr:aminotransferase class V-fold PLP-dependent enzyme [Actinomadura parmotrematis]MBW8483967.1 aminotransferase class V-fold PLP-dependent enzyme [Actinomadura parmotrematis]